MSDGYWDGVVEMSCVGRAHDGCFCGCSGEMMGEERGLEEDGKLSKRRDMIIASIDTE